MFTFYLGIYTLILALLWWFFIIAKLHAYKFKNFSLHITKVTNFLLVFLIILSITWYFLIFYSTNTTTTQVKDYTNTDSNSEVNY